MTDNSYDEYYLGEKFDGVQFVHRRSDKAVVGAYCGCHLGIDEIFRDERLHEIYHRYLLRVQGY